MDSDRSVGSKRTAYADEEKVIPWAEGNGLWGTITGLVSNLIGVDIITFFVQNPYTCDSVQSIAIRVGRQAQRVKPILEDLTDAGLLQASDLDGIRIFQLTDESNRRQTLQQYVTWLREGYHWARMAME